MWFPQTSQATLREGSPAGYSSDKGPFYTYEVLIVGRLCGRQSPCYLESSVWRRLMSDAGLSTPYAMPSCSPSVLSATATHLYSFVSLFQSLFLLHLHDDRIHIPRLVCLVTSNTLKPSASTRPHSAPPIQPYAARQTLLRRSLAELDGRVLAAQVRRRDERERERALAPTSHATTCPLFPAEFPGEMASSQDDAIEEVTL